MIRVYGDFDAQSGYATHAVNLVRHLRRLVHIDIDNLYSPLAVCNVPGDLRELVAKQPETEPTVGLLIGGLEAIQLLKAKIRIACVVFETTKIPSYYIEQIQRLDQVWVVSDWCLQSLVDQGVDRQQIKVVPEGVSPLSSSDRKPYTSNGSFKFLSVAKWEARKCQKQLVEVFKRTFSASEPVQLILHAHNPFISNFSIDRQLFWHRMGRWRQIVASQPVAAESLEQLYQQADVFVLPTRGEAWGLPVIEAMASGMPTIATQYSGISHYMLDNPLALKVDRLVPVFDPQGYQPNEHYGLWAEPCWEHLGRLMRLVFEQHEHYLRHAQIQAGVVSERYSWQRAAQIAKTEVDQLVAHHLQA